MNLVKQVTSTMGADKKDLLRQKTEEAEAAAKEAQEAAKRAERLAKEVKDLAEQLKKGKATKSLVSDDEQKKAEEADSSSSSSSSSDSESDSDSEEAKPTAVKKEAAKKESDDSSSSSSDDSSSDEEEDKMEVTKTEKVAKKEEPDSSSSSDSDSSSSESEDEEEAPKAKTATKKTEAKEESDDSSSDSDSDDDDDEEEDKTEKAPEKSNGKRKAEEAVEDAPTPKKAAVTDEAESNKVYVRGLPWKAADYEVQEFFASCGAIKSCEMPLMDDGRSSGTAIIEFETTEAAAAAIELNGQDFQGRWLSIKYSSPKPILSSREPTQKQDGCVTVFVGNLSWDIDEDTLRQVFGECGEITSVRFATDRESGEFKGFGHIEFTETEATDKAIALAGTDILGRQVRVDYANDKKAGGGFGGGGGGRGNDRNGGGRGRGGGGRGRGGGGGGRGGRGAGGNSFNSKKTGSIAAFSGKKISFD